MLLLLSVLRDDVAEFEPFHAFSANTPSRSLSCVCACVSDPLFHMVAEGCLDIDGVSGQLTANCAGNAQVHFDSLTGSSSVTSTGGSITLSLSSPIVCGIQASSTKPMQMSPGAGGRFQGNLGDTFANGVLDATGVETVDPRDDPTPKSRSSGKISDAGRLMGVFASQVHKLDVDARSTITASALAGAVSIKVLTWIDKIRIGMNKKKAAERAEAGAGKSDANVR